MTARRDACLAAAVGLLALTAIVGLVSGGPLNVGDVATSRQEEAPGEGGSQISLEANPFRGTLGYTRHVNPEWEVGMTGGFGFPQFDQTLAPDKGNFEDIFHIGVLTRYEPSEKAALDLDLRIGLADLRDCTGGDCFPGGYIGLSAGMFLGWRHLKFGPRLTLAQYGDQGYRPTRVVAVTPLSVRASFEL